MIRQRALKIMLVLVGFLFSAAVYPVTMILWQRDQAGYADAMMGSIYLTLGILLLMTVRNPSAHRSLILFAGWSSVAHASVMAIMAVRDPRAHEHLWGVGIFAIIGIPLLLLAPTKQREERSLASGA
jgi:Family of unknown function (DUF6632)